MATPNLTAEEIHRVRKLHDAKFWRQPNVVAVSEGYFKDTNGGWMNVIEIVVHVSEKVSPTTVPSEDRISDIIDGVPVQIRVDEWGDLEEAMGAVNEERRPLTSGMRIESGMSVPTKGSA